MLPVIIGAALLGGGALWLLSDHKPASGAKAGPVPKAIVDAIARAVKTGDPGAMHQLAGTIRAQGFAEQADSLERAATELDSVIKSTPAAVPGRQQVPVSGKGSRVNPAPRADDPKARRQAGQLAQLLSSMTLAEARSSAAVKTAVTDYELLERARGFYVGNIDGLYGPKAALTLATDHGIVPPHPLYWPKKDKAGAKAVYVQNLQRFSAADPQRREEWLQAMHVDND